MEPSAVAHDTLEAFKRDLENGLDYDEKAMRVATVNSLILLVVLGTVLLE